MAGNVGQRQRREVHSWPALRRDFLVQGRVDPLERSYQLTASLGVESRIGGAGAMRRFERGELGEQPLALAFESLALHRGTTPMAPLDRSEPASQQQRHGKCQRYVARPHWR